MNFQVKQQLFKIYRNAKLRRTVLQSAALSTAILPCCLAQLLRSQHTNEIFADCLSQHDFLATSPGRPIVALPLLDNSMSKVETRPENQQTSCKCRHREYDNWIQYQYKMSFIGAWNFNRTFHRGLSFCRLCIQIRMFSLKGSTE